MPACDSLAYTYPLNHACSTYLYPSQLSLAYAACLCTPSLALHACRVSLTLPARSYQAPPAPFASICRVFSPAPPDSGYRVSPIPPTVSRNVESARLFNRISPALPPEYVILVYHACRACSASVNPPSSRLRCLLSMSFLSHLLTQCIRRV